MEKEEEENSKRILKDLFGESSSEEEDERDNHNSSKWEQIEEIKGLWLCRDFLSLEQQSSLLLAIQKEGWFTEVSHNQAMRFGDLPAWATELSTSIREVVCCCETVAMCENMELCSPNSEGACPMPANLLWREPLFDQLIANVYQPGEGICAHVDLMRFEDGIAIVSLESPCVMHFSQVETEPCGIEEGAEKETPVLKIPVFLAPGSLILMFGEARYLWKHEINRKPGFQVWGGKEIDQQKRTSVTLRKLCSSK